MEDIIQVLSSGETFIITGHVGPDGDSLACQLALAEGLEQLGKTVSLQSRDPIPYIYCRLPGVNRIETVEKPYGQYDVAIAVECPVISRSGFDSLPAARLVGIDHHPDFALEADAVWVDSTATATAILVFKLLQAMGCTITQNIAENLYAGILTDSGSFNFSNTTPEALEISAELVRLGASPSDISDKVYRTYPLDRLLIMKDLLASMQLLSQERVAILSIDHKTLTEKNYALDLFENTVNIPLITDTVLYSVLVRESAPKIWRVSLRSKNFGDVGEIARSFGGGGHRYAAGFTTEGTLEDVVDEIAQRIQKQLER